MVIVEVHPYGQMFLHKTIFSPRKSKPKRRIRIASKKALSAYFHGRSSK